MKENAVIGSLFENLDQIEIIFKETHFPFQNDKGNTGDAKEYSIQEFISSYLTSDYRIEKGCIYSLENNSNNIDCVILAPNHPKLTTPKRKIILAEGVYAAIEIKPDIKNKVEFLRGLKQIKSIKKLKRKTYVPDFSRLMKTEPRKDYENRIPSVLFSVKSLKPDDLYAFIKEQIEKKIIEITDIPDMILTLDNGLYVFSPDIRKKPFGKWFIENSKIFSNSTMLHFCDSNKSKTLAIFLLNLLNLPSPILKNQDFILNEYLKNITGFKICGYDFGIKK